jgi:hypothetical protein
MPEPGDGFSTGVAVGGWASSAQTSISFTLVDGGQVLRAGDFTWPFGGVSALDASAASLRESAEALSKAMTGLKCRSK